MSVPTITRIGVVIDALVDLTETALGDMNAAAIAAGKDPIVVMDGPRLGELPWRHLMLGTTDSPDVAPYQTSYTRQEGFGAPRYVEDWEVRCGLCLADGGNDVAALRAEAVTVLGLLDEALRATHQLAGVWDDAGIGETPMSWYAVPHHKGSTVLVAFSLEGGALL